MYTFGTKNAQLEQFLFEEACRMEQSAALMGRAREFLKEQRVLEPAEFRIARIVGADGLDAFEADLMFPQITDFSRSLYSFG
jgi:hypothetical protein